VSAEQPRRTPSLYDRMEIADGEVVRGWIVYGVGRSATGGEPQYVPGRRRSRDHPELIRRTRIPPPSGYQPQVRRPVVGGTPLHRRRPDSRTDPVLAERTLQNRAAVHAAAGWVKIHRRYSKGVPGVRAKCMTSAADEIRASPRAPGPLSNDAACRPAQYAVIRSGLAPVSTPLAPARAASTANPRNPKSPGSHPRPASSPWRRPADRESKRLHAPLVLPGCCALYVRGHCHASTHSDPY